MKSVLSEKTVIPLSFVVTICAGIYMFARVSSATEVNARDTEDLRADLKSLQSEVLVALKDQQANIYEIRTQGIILDTKMSLMDARLVKMGKR